MYSILSSFGDAGVWAGAGPCTYSVSFFHDFMFMLIFGGMLVGDLLLIPLLMAYLIVRIIANVKHSNTTTIKKINKIFKIASFVAFFVIFTFILFGTFQHSECWK